MASPTSRSKTTSWLREKFARRINSGGSTEGSTVVEVDSIPIERYSKTRSHDPFEEEEEEPVDWEVLTLSRPGTTAMDSNQADGGQSANKSSRKISGGQQTRMAGALGSPNLGGRSSVSGVTRSSLKQDKRHLEIERPVSAGAAVQRGTGKKKLLSVNSTQNIQSGRTPSPNLERNTSQRSSFRRKTSDQKSSSPGPGLREASPDPGQGSAFSKVRDTLRIRKGKKKKGTKVAYSVPEFSFGNKYQDPFETLPDYGESDDKIDEGMGHEFSFVNVPHHHPEYCDYCQQAAWGHHQVLKCTKCDFICHKKCENRIFMKCSSKIESEALLQQDRANEAFDESIEVLEKESKTPSDGPNSTTSVSNLSAQPLSEKALLVKKIREYNRRTTPVHHIHIKPRDAVIDYQGFVRVHMCIQRPIHVSTGVTRTSWYRLMRPVKERSIDSGIDAGLETAFYLPTDTNRLVHITDVTTTKDLIVTLLKKFCITDHPKKFSLYEEYGSDSRRLFDEDHPLQVVLEASVVGRNSKLALRDNLCSTIQWDAFSLPELQNFIAILSREEGIYADRLRECFINWKKHLHDQLIEKQGSDPFRSVSGPSTLGSISTEPFDRSTTDPLSNGEAHPLAVTHQAKSVKV